MQVMVANEEEGGDVAGGKAVDAFGEFPLLGLVWFTGLIGIAAEQDEVRAVFQGIIHQPVEGGKEVQGSGRESGFRINMPVGLYTQVQVGKMEDFH